MGTAPGCPHSGDTRDSPSRSNTRSKYSHPSFEKRPESTYHGVSNKISSANLARSACEGGVASAASRVVSNFRHLLAEVSYTPRRFAPSLPSQADLAKLAESISLQTSGTRIPNVFQHEWCEFLLPPRRFRAVPPSQAHLSKLAAASSSQTLTAPMFGTILKVEACLGDHKKNSPPAKEGRERSERGVFNFQHLSGGSCKPPRRFAPSPPSQAGSFLHN